MASTTLKQLLPYNHSIAIVSPNNGGTIAQYAKIVKVDDGLNSALSTITTQTRVGADGAIYVGNKSQYKAMTFTIDVSDNRITWDDFYSFFSKDAIYKIVMDDRYTINGVISKISNPMFNNIDGYAEITMECDASYWSEFLTTTIGPLTMNYVSTQTIELINGIPTEYEGQEFEPEIIITIGELAEAGLTGLNILPYDSADSNKIQLTWLDILVPTTGATISFNPCKSNIVTFDYGTSKTQMTVSGWPSGKTKLKWRETYLFNLVQTDIMTATQATLQINGKGRYYN